MNDTKHYNSWLEINLDYLTHNIKTIKDHIGPYCEIMAVIKGNAYGHGAIAVAKHIERIYPKAQFAVANVWEGLELRRADIRLPILVLGPIPDFQLEEAIENDLSMTLFNVDNAKLASNISKKLKKNTKAHIKIDSGLRRIGFKPGEELKELINSIKDLHSLDIVGVFTHFAESGTKDKSFTLKQLDIFKKALKQLKENGISPPYIHCAGSNTILDMPECHFNLVRAGKVIYGYHGIDYEFNKVILKPILEWKAVVTHIGQLLPGESIGYSRTFTANSNMRIAVVPVGFTDGYSSLLSNKGSILIHGEKASLVGKVCMDSCFADITNIDNVHIGDIVTILGEEGKEKIEKSDICKITGFKLSEVLATIGRRVTRTYIKNSEPVSIDEI